MQPKVLQQLSLFGDVGNNDADKENVFDGGQRVLLVLRLGDSGSKYRETCQLTRKEFVHGRCRQTAVGNSRTRELGDVIDTRNHADA